MPGDGLLLATKAVGVGATAAGVGAAVAGRVLRWPRMTYGFEAAVVAVDYQPRVRRLLEDSIGPIRDGHAAELRYDGRARH